MSAQNEGMSDRLDAVQQKVGEAVEQVAEAAGAVYDGARSFLASEQGRRLRSQVATGLIAAAPALTALPVVRRTPLGKLLVLAGGSAVVVKVAEAIRDWEPASPQGV